MLCERNGVHLADVQSFPFFDPEAAPNPNLAADALQRISERLMGLAELPELEQARQYDTIRQALDEDVFDFFDLSPNERKLVRETVEILMPSIRPRSFKSLDTPAQKPARAPDFQRYGEALAESLTDWRSRTGGRGSFRVSVVASGPDREGPAGIVRIDYTPDESAPPVSEARVSDDLVRATLQGLRTHGLAMVPSGDALHLVPDTWIWANGTLYLVRPLARRSWTFRRALQDAEAIVGNVQRRHREQVPVEVA